jgi:hypothetical protein
VIVFTLQCPADHRFEGWFRDGATFDAQAAHGEIACAVCGDTAITKAPMAPAVVSRRASAPEPAQPVPEKAAEIMATLRELRAKIEANCDYVGPNFAEEAKRIHYGEVDPRPIYGEATEEEASSLAEDGIEVAKIPWLPREN